MNAVDPKIAAEAQGPYATYREALEEKRLTFQHCRTCSNDWLPPREDCPRCWSSNWKWREASGKATVVSFVVYHTAFDKRFAERLPYNVALVDLDEGPRLITNLVNLPEGQDVIARKVGLVFEEDHGRMLPRFRLEDGAKEESET